jgi:hypothetical protein
MTLVVYGYAVFTRVCPLSVCLSPYHGLLYNNYGLYVQVSSQRSSLK